jgi:hypothetical protein
MLPVDTVFYGLPLIKQKKYFFASVKRLCQRKVHTLCLEPFFKTASKSLINSVRSTDLPGSNGQAKGLQISPARMVGWRAHEESEMPIKANMVCAYMLVYIAAWV